jgi:hypothetical protein
MAITYTSGQVGTCLKFYTNLGPTIQGAVNQMSPGGVLYVCPGIYNEQVVITQPLTLNGVDTTNNPPSTHASVVIAAPPTLGWATVPDLDGSGPIAAQLLINTVTTGDVNIYNLTVDGNNNQLPGCGPNLVGIYYRNASGTASYVNAINQNVGPNGGCSLGFGIFVESGDSGSSTVTVANSYVAAYSKNGIVARYPGTTATFTTNAVFGLGLTAGDAENGIEFYGGAAGSAKFNTVMDNLWQNPATAASTGILVDDSANIVSNNNVIGNDLVGIYYASVTAGAANGGTINSNHVYATHVYDGIDVCSSNNTVNSNVVTGSDESGIHLDSGCASSGNGNAVQSNVLAAACAGILEDPTTTNTITGNFFNTVTYTIDNLSTTCGTPLSPVNGKQHVKVRP